MGKLIRNGIEYGGGNGTDIFEVTQAEYDVLVQAGTLVHNALYVITDAPNLNATAQDISYDGSTATIYEKLEDKAFTTFTNGAYKKLTNGCVLLYLNGATHQQDLPIPLPDRSYYFTGLNQSNAVCGFFINTSGRLSIINSSTNTAVYGCVVYST